MARFTVSKAKQEFPELVERAATSGKRTIVARRGRPVAALVPIKDLRLLERLARKTMDRNDVEDARTALAEPGENISWEKVKSDLGL